jgi:hypothetical protein
MTLIEMLMAVGIGFLLLAGITVVLVSAFRSFTGMSNYVAMDLNSRGALDQLSLDIRKSKDIVSCTSNQLVLNYDGITNLTYGYQTTNRVLTRQLGTLSPDTLLTGCDAFEFKMFQKTPQAGGDFPLATTLAQAKAINVTWKCSRLCFGAVTNTEDMQQAAIVIRNKLAN